MDWSTDTKDGYDDLEVYMEYKFVFVSSTGRNHAKMATFSFNIYLVYQNLFHDICIGRSKLNVLVYVSIWTIPGCLVASAWFSHMVRFFPHDDKDTRHPISQLIHAICVTLTHTHTHTHRSSLIDAQHGADSVWNSAFKDDHWPYSKLWDPLRVWFNKLILGLFEIHRES